MQFTTTFVNPMAELANKIKNGTTWRVLAVLPGVLSYTEWKRLDQKQLGHSLGMTQSAISKALVELVELGFIERQGKGPAIEWKLSPDYGWKGDVDSYHAEMRKRAERKKPAPSRPTIVAEAELCNNPLASAKGRTADCCIIPL